MIKFKTREPLNTIHNISPTEDIEKLTALLNELFDLGWDWSQWSTKLPDYDSEDISNLDPEYKNLSEKDKRKFVRTNISQIPKHYFIESFGNPVYGYLRGEGKSLVECAEKIVRRAKQQINCSHKWKYTHSNGFKTCEKCYAFVQCTVEEALANYEKGNVEVNDNLSLYFHNKRPICSCGSKKVYYLDPSMLYEKQYQCVSCLEYLPQKFKGSRYSSLPVSPNDDGYAEASTECEGSFSRHRFMSLGVMSEGHLKSQIIRYIGDMLKHFYFVENGKEIEAFIEWVTPYVYKTVKDTETQILVDEKKYKLNGIKDLQIKLGVSDEKMEVLYGLDIELPEKENDDPEVVMKNVFEALLKNDE